MTRQEVRAMRPTIWTASLALTVLLGACDNAPGPGQAKDSRTVTRADTSRADVQPADAAPVDLPRLDQSPDETVPLPDLAESSAFGGMDWSSTDHTGGMNPSFKKSTLGSWALVVTLSSLYGGIKNTCKAKLTLAQRITLLAAAAKVRWIAVKSTYIPGGRPNCGYPGSTGSLDITLHYKTTRKPLHIKSEWCASTLTGAALSLPSDLHAFIKTKRQVENAACPSSCPAP